jgi:RNA polymerase sigma factor (sigma-70 family)
MKNKYLMLNERNSLLNEVKMGNIEARNLMLQEYMYLIKKVGEYFKELLTNTFEYDDMIIEGTIGFIKGVTNYNELLHSSFKPYITKSIFIHIAKACLQQGYSKALINIKLSIIKKYINIKKDCVINNLSEPSLYEIMYSMNTNWETILRLSRVLNKESIINIKDDVNYCVELETKDHDNQLIIDEVSNLVKKELTYSERIILYMHYEMNNHSKKSYEQIGKLLNQSSSNIYYTEAKIFRKLRKEANKKCLFDLID